MFPRYALIYCDCKNIELKGSVFSVYVLFSPSGSHFCRKSCLLSDFNNFHKQTNKHISNSITNIIVFEVIGLSPFPSNLMKKLKPLASAEHDCSETTTRRFKKDTIHK